MESRRWLHDRVARLHELLRDAHGGATGGDGAGQVPQPHARAGHAGDVDWPVRCDETTLDVPLRWRKPRFVFVNSMSDLFHADVPERFIARVWETMAAARRHTFQILTKRPDRMRRVTERLAVLPNVWLGTSIETADYLPRLDALRATRAAVRFASFEPLLGAITDANLEGIHWAIVGGESGPGARPMDADWVRSLRRQCEDQGVEFFFKQWGGIHKTRAGRKLDGRTWNAMPSVDQATKEMPAGENVMAAGSAPI